MVIKKVITFLIIAVGVVFGWYWTEGYGITDTDVTGDSIEEAIFQFVINTNHINRQGKIIEEVQLEKDTVLVFTLNQTYESIHASLIKKKWNGKWRVEDMSSGAPVERHPGETHPYYWLGLGTDDLSGYWGIIYDSNVESIMLENQKEEDEAIIIDTNKAPRIWYKLYPVSDINNIDIKAIDLNGKEIPWNNPM